ncbi:hypothetical protein TNCT_550441 [Trichonephila clavata]|uniref:Uncharacterized protein n=1 Tax=Trichonephila clavata TaxID=2740835 RepID=A0A8X6JC74_TRICU|nr:hypothetical protein TNCT_550441 [Trichonephila clavata]
MAPPGGRLDWNGNKEAKRKINIYIGWWLYHEYIRRKNGIYSDRKHYFSLCSYIQYLSWLSTILHKTSKERSRHLVKVAVLPKKEFKGLMLFFFE